MRNSIGDREIDSVKNNTRQCDGGSSAFPRVEMNTQVFDRTAATSTTKR